MAAERWSGVIISQTSDHLCVLAYAVKTQNWQLATARSHATIVLRKEVSLALITMRCKCLAPAACTRADHLAELIRYSPRAIHTLVAGSGRLPVIHAPADMFRATGENPVQAVRVDCTHAHMPSWAGILRFTRPECPANHAED